MQIEDLEVNLLGSTLEDIARAVTGKYPSPAELNGKVTTLSGEEEEALGQRFGMFWPHELLQAFCQAYRERNIDCRGGAGAIGFIGDESVTCTFYIASNTQRKGEDK